MAKSLSIPPSASISGKSLVVHSGRAPAKPLAYDPIGSVVYNVLVYSYWMEQNPKTTKLWRRAWKKSGELFPDSVRTRIHGYRVIVNFGHLYPLFARRFQHFNNPVVELTYQTYVTLGRAINLIDVGANVGDTILLLQSNCPDMLGSFYCIEGHPKFFAYLEHNLKIFKNGTLAQVVLSSSDGLEASLVHTHTSTASAKGEATTPARSLDSLFLESKECAPDVIKIDADGFDGKILSGGRELLAFFKPAVIFEWHPALYLQTGNDTGVPFETLFDVGYSTYVFYDKYGDFSHLMANYDPESVSLLSEFCLQSGALKDWHYDVVALHANSPLSTIALSNMGYARARRSRH